MVTRPVVVLETTTGVFIAGASFLPPSGHLRRAQTLPIHASLVRPIFRPVTLVPIWAIHTRRCRVSGFTPMALTRWQ
jgi:hypothetical protein